MAGILEINLLAFLLIRGLGVRTTNSIRQAQLLLVHVQLVQLGLTY